MGANISLAEKNVLQDIRNIMNATCTNVSDSEQTIKGINIKLQGCNAGNITLRNTKQLNQSCDMDVIANSLAESVQGATSEQVLGLGIGANVNIDKQNAKSQILTKLETECGSTDKVRQRVENNTIDLSPQCYGGEFLGIGRQCFPCSVENIELVNDSTAYQQCVQSVVSEAINRAKQESVSKQVIDALPDLGALALLSLSPCIIIVVIIILGMLKPKPSNADNAAIDLAKGDAGAKANVNPVQKGMLEQLGKRSGDLKGLAGKLFGGGSKLLTGEIPIIVVLIFALVWYGAMTDPRRRRRS